MSHESDIPDLHEETCEYGRRVFERNRIKHGLSIHDTQLVPHSEFNDPPEGSESIPSFHFQRERLMESRRDEVEVIQYNVTRGFFDRDIRTNKNIYHEIRESGMTDETMAYYLGRSIEELKDER